MSGAQGPPFPLVAATYGGVFWGLFASTALFGVNTVQGWIYLTTNKDKWPLRLVVVVLLLLDLVHLVLGGKILHHYFVDNFGNPAIFLEISVFINAEFSVTVAVVLIVQLYFASRVYLLHPTRKWIPTLIVTCATATCVAGIVSNCDQIRQNNQAAAILSKSIRIEAGIDHSMATLTDIITTVALSTSFFERQSRFRRTRNVIQKILRYTVTRGFLVTIFQFLFLVLYEAAPANLTWAFFHYCLSRIYIVTMIAMLNSRASLRLELEEPLEFRTSVLHNLRNTNNIRLDEITRSSRVVEIGMNVELPEDPIVSHETENTTQKRLSSYNKG